MVDTVPQVLKSNQHVMKVRWEKRNLSHLVCPQWVLTNPPVPKSSFWQKDRPLNENSAYLCAVILTHTHITWRFGLGFLQLKGFDLKRYMQLWHHFIPYWFLLNDLQGHGRVCLFNHIRGACFCVHRNISAREKNVTCVVTCCTLLKKICDLTNKLVNISSLTAVPMPFQDVHLQSVDCLIERKW